MTETNALDREVLRVLTRQREKGKAKYGVSLADAGLTPLEVLAHLQEELADALYYVTAVRMEMEAER